MLDHPALNLSLLLAAQKESAVIGQRSEQPNAPNARCLSVKFTWIIIIKKKHHPLWGSPKSPYDSGCTAISFSLPILPKRVKEKKSNCVLSLRSHLQNAIITCTLYPYPGNLAGITSWKDHRHRSQPLLLLTLNQKNESHQVHIRITWEVSKKLLIQVPSYRFGFR